MNEIVLTINSTEFKFRHLAVEDVNWLNTRFATKEKPIGALNFQDRISDFGNYALLAQTLTIVMHHLLISPKNTTLNQFEKDFGTSYKDIAQLYMQFNFCVGNTSKAVGKLSKIVLLNWKLKKENRDLKFKVAKEKIKSFFRMKNGL